jgi:transketolase
MRLEPLAEKWRAFGWAVRELDGHDLAALSTALHGVPFEPGKPSLVLAATTKGKGVSFAEGDHRYHYCKLTAEQAERALCDLEAARPR